MARLIDLDELLKYPLRRGSGHCDEKNANPQFLYGVESVLEWAEDYLSTFILLPDTREPVEKGKWFDAYGDFSAAKCSKCGEIFDVSDTNENLKVLFEAFKKYYNFCPSCGQAKTDKAVQMVMERMDERG